MWVSPDDEDLVLVLGERPAAALRKWATITNRTVRLGRPEWTARGYTGAGLAAVSEGVADTGSKVSGYRGRHVRRALALEVSIMRTHLDDGLTMDVHPNYIDPLRWNPLFMKFT